jgi:uncharacterized DUF497 family protein
MLKYEFDKNKSNKNKKDKSREFGFEKVEFFCWEGAVTIRDLRKDYNEIRYISFGLIFDRLHTLIWTYRNDIVRVISLRKANKREVRFYEKERQKQI